MTIIFENVVCGRYLDSNMVASSSSCRFVINVHIEVEFEF